MKVCKKELHLAFPQGPCFGVKRSIELCRKILEKHEVFLLFTLWFTTKLSWLTLQSMGWFWRKT